MSIIGIQTQLSEAKSQAKHLNSLKNDISVSQKVTKDLKDDMEQINKRLGEVLNELSECKRLVKKQDDEIQGLKNELNDSKLNDDHVTREELAKELGVVSECIQEYIYQATPRVQEDKFESFELRLKQLEEKERELEEKKKHPQVPEIKIIKREAFDIDNGIFRKPQKKNPQV